MEKVHSINKSASFEKNQLLQKSEEIKLKIISILLWKKLISDEKAENLKSLEETKKYIIDLYKNRKIDSSTYIEIGVKSWSIKLGIFLVLKWYITKERLIKALNEINNEQEKKLLWVYLVDNKLIPLDLMLSSLDELWIIKLWEYLTLKWLIQHSDVKRILNKQKNNLSFWQILIHEWIINQKELNSILSELWINMTINDLWLEYQNTDSSLYINWNLEEAWKKRKIEIYENCIWKDR